LNPSINLSESDLSSASGKFEVLLSLLDKIKFAGEKVIVFATYRRMIDIIEGIIAIRYSFKAGVIDGRTMNVERQSIIDNFTSLPGFAVLILHPRTAGVGLNITAATHVIHYSRQWNPALEIQATARAWRNGQTKMVSAYYLFYANSIEEDIDERLRQKQALSNAVISLADEKISDKQLILNYLGRKEDDK
jgi:SNF2 family DNA or RNA helicase